MYCENARSGHSNINTNINKARTTPIHLHSLKKHALWIFLCIITLWLHVSRLEERALGWDICSWRHRCSVNNPVRVFITASELFCPHQTRLQCSRTRIWGYWIRRGPLYCSICTNCINTQHHTKCKKGTLPSTSSRKATILAYKPAYLDRQRWATNMPRPAATMRTFHPNNTYYDESCLLISVPSHIHWSVLRIRLSRGEFPHSASDILIPVFTVKIIDTRRKIKTRYI